MDLAEKVRKLEKRIKELEKGEGKKPKQKRAPSEYNKFMKAEGAKLKKNNPEWSQPDIMREVARLWTAKKEVKSKSSPKK